MTPRPRLAAFGSSRTSPDDPLFGDVEQLCEKLGRAGWNGVTGGHQGMMAAFSQGIRAGGGHIRGITLERFPTPPRNSLSEEVRARDFFDRMRSLIEDADAYLVLPGGLGTLAELAMTWDLLAIRVLEPRPLILYGDMWQPLIEVIREQLVFSVDHAFDGIHPCTTHAQVLQHLQGIAPHA
ncbi:MAG TPA: LOG family protein [Mariprofundaceae bacterium]|nr:LOG family protein [Mariprofundaceae bacterium]